VHVVSCWCAVTCCFAFRAPSPFSVSRASDWFGVRSDGVRSRRDAGIAFRIAWGAEREYPSRQTHSSSSDLYPVSSEEHKSARRGLSSADTIHNTFDNTFQYTTTTLTTSRRASDREIC
jgi:hypothetical protein